MKKILWTLTVPAVLIVILLSFLDTDIPVQARSTNASVHLALDKNASTITTTPPVSITLVSYYPSGEQIANQLITTLWNPIISGDGSYVAFTAVPSGIYDQVYMYDRYSGTTELVSATFFGGKGNGNSLRPSVSHDGRYVMFRSGASNLVENDSFGLFGTSVFLYDRAIKEIGTNNPITRVYPLDQENKMGVLSPMISGNGQSMALGYRSNSFGSMEEGIIVRDLTAGVNTLITDTYSSPFISENGRYATFVIDYNVFLYDIGAGEMTVISVNSEGEEANDISYNPVVSSDGKYIAFMSRASNLVEGDNNDEFDTFLHNRLTAKTVRISTSSSGGDANDRSSYGTSISADGRYVVFSSLASNLVEGDTNGCEDVFVYDTAVETLTPLLVTEGGQTAPECSTQGNISADGRYITFMSNNLANDTTYGHDIYVKEMGYYELFSISGTVRDLDGNPLSDVTVSTNSGAQTITDAQGEYTLSNMGAGTYSITAEAEIYAIITPTRSVTIPPATSNVDFVACHSETLPEQFAPSMFFHAQENYRPIDITVPLLNSELVRYQFHADGIDRVVIAKSPSAIDLLNANSPHHFIDFEGSGEDELLAAYQSFNPEPTLLVYARLYCPPPFREQDLDISSEKSLITAKTQTAIQYWFFYYDNPWHWRHEGDWEMIQVMLDSQKEPLAAGYSHHYSGQWRYWENMDQENNHPFVYVSNGGHGSYFRGAAWSLDNYFDSVLDDTTTDMETGIIYGIEMLPIADMTQDTWLYFVGHWGTRRDSNNFNDGPPGPLSRTANHLPGRPSLWYDPLKWFSNLEDYETSSSNKRRKINISVPESLEIHIEPITSRVNLTQPTDIEYFQNPETKQRTLIVHNPDPTMTYETIFTAEKSGNLIPESQTVTIHFTNFYSDTLVTAQYQLPELWDTTSRANIILPFLQDAQLAVDTNGDGVIEQRMLPVDYTEQPLNPEIQNIYLPLLINE